MGSKIGLIQAIRLYATLAIVMFHTDFVIGDFNKFGVFGVHIFFIISGYVMAGICEGDSRNFIARRLIRVCPPYWTMTLLLYLIAIYHPDLVKTTRADMAELLKSFFFVPFVKSSGLIQPILFVGWTLNYEMVFYLLLTMGLMISRRHATVFTSGALLCLFLGCYPFRSRGAVAAFYSDPLIFEFILGMLCFYAVRAVPEMACRRLKYVSGAVLVGSLIWLPVMEMNNWLAWLSDLPRFAPPTMLAIASSCVLARSGCDLQGGLVVLMGDATYVMYLIHSYVVSGMDRILGRRLPAFSVNKPAGCATAIVAVILIAYVIHLNVERPVVKRLGRLFRRSERQVQAVAAAA